MVVARVLVCLTGVLILTACSAQGPDDKAARRVPELPSYDHASCRDVQPYEGKTAPKENHLQNNYVTEKNFNKTYDRADLDAVLKASAVQTSVYVMDMGVNVYRIPRAYNQCPMFYALPEVPANLMEVWNEIAGGNGEGQLAGAYFEICEGTCSDFQMTNPTILVHEASDRWTLVHEMMHHNFNVIRKANRSLPGINAVREQLMAGQANLEQLVGAYETNKDRGTLTKNATQLSSMIDNIYVLLVNTTFEEIAIESLLLDEAAHGRFGYISTESANSAVWYIKYSREDGLRHFDAFSDILLKVGREASKNEWRDINTIINRAQGDIDEIRSKTANIVAKAETEAPEVERRSDIRGRIVIADGATPQSVSEAPNYMDYEEHARLHDRKAHESIEAAVRSIEKVSNKFGN
jgi:hypothetical protein